VIDLRKLLMWIPVRAFVLNEANKSATSVT
jgi:hypothetical protein